MVIKSKQELNNLIKSSKNELEEVFDCISTPMFISDKNRTILRANKALVHKLSASFSDLLGKKCYMVMHGKNQPPKGCLFEKAKATGKAINEEKGGYIFKGEFATIVQKIPSKYSNKELYLHSIKDISMTKDLIKQVIYAVETERKVLASEIHDDLLQAGFCAITHINSVYQKSTNKEVRKRLELAMKSLDGLLGSGRKIIKGLKPPMLQTIGLISAIKEHANNILGGHSIVCNLVKSKLPKLPEEIEISILRVVQESLMNVLKHSKASKVEISLRLREKRNFVELVISDNGTGLPDNFEKSNGHVGITLMRERVEMHNGCFCLNSSPGKGTNICAIFPFNIVDKVTPEFCCEKL